MTSTLKRIIFNFSALLLVALTLTPAAAYAADPPPPPSVEIRHAACAGSNITITSDPSDTACEKINNDDGSTVNKIIKDVINILTAAVGVLAVIMIIVAGFRYVTSGGSDDAVKGAKRTITYAILGLVVVALAQIIVHFVLSKTTQATTPQCLASGNTHKWDSGPNAGKTCTP